MSKEILNEHLFILYAVLSQYFYWHIKVSFKVLITVLYTKKTCQHLGEIVLYILSLERNYISQVSLENSLKGMKKAPEISGFPKL